MNKPKLDPQMTPMNADSDQAGFHLCQSAQSADAHSNIATALLRDMFDRNLKHAGRMLDIGDCNSAKRLLQSAISQCDQIASYNQPPNKTEIVTEV